MTYLPDVNVWIALAAELHTHHRVARHWFSNLQDEKLAFCRITAEAPDKDIVKDPRNQLI